MAHHTWLPSPAPPSFCPGLQKGLHLLVLAFAVFSKLHEGPRPEPLFLCCDWLPTDDEMGRGKLSGALGGHSYRGQYDRLASGLFQVHSSNRRPQVGMSSPVSLSQRMAVHQMFALQGVVPPSSAGDCSCSRSRSSRPAADPQTREATWPVAGGGSVGACPQDRSEMPCTGTCGREPPRRRLQNYNWQIVNQRIDDRCDPAASLCSPHTQCAQ